ncbi:23015_t:CDS:2, partial [Entrophospora sp. SA101]
FWGKKAKLIKEEYEIGDEFSLTSTHPSPFSAKYGFFGSKPFSKLCQLEKHLVNLQTNEQQAQILQPPYRILGPSKIIIQEVVNLLQSTRPAGELHQNQEFTNFKID